MNVPFFLSFTDTKKGLNLDKTNNTYLIRLLFLSLLLFCFFLFVCFFVFCFCLFVCLLLFLFVCLFVCLFFFFFCPPEINNHSVSFFLFFTGPSSSVGRVSAQGNGRSRVRSRAETYQSC